ncbi:ABC transporter permease [Paenibacillaceae bacterium]|nr:ABC transporter permease [Paenibacillaceae bacterium]
MKFSTFLRHVREGCKDVIRNGWMSFASISSMCISLFILGVFVLLALNVNHLFDEVEGTVAIRVYMQLETDEAKIKELQTKIGDIPEVKKIRFISKEEGFEIMRTNFGESGKEILDGYDLDNNPIPDSFTVEVNDPKTISYVAKVIESINEQDGLMPINSVKYGQGTVETLFKVTTAVRNIGLVIVAGLAVTAMFLIANTIKMTIISRRREIGIMKLVGATNNFIRWPFFIEGAIIGVVGSVITTVVLLVGYYQLLQVSEFQLGLMMIRLVQFEEAAIPLAALLISIGTLIGIWGSTISVRKYLKV